MKTLAIDPAKDHLGCAIFRKDGTLERAWYDDHVDWHTWPSKVTKFVIEKPQVYQKNIASANSLIDVAISIGKLCSLALAFDAKVFLYLPAEWKGSTPKPIHNERVLASLSDTERQRVDLPKNKKKASDVMDAIGLGRFHLGLNTKAGVRK